MLAVAALLDTPKHISGGGRRTRRSPGDVTMLARGHPGQYKREVYPSQGHRLTH
jgi:hypothetical protein